MARQSKFKRPGLEDWLRSQDGSAPDFREKLDAFIANQNVAELLYATNWEKSTFHLVGYLRSGSPVTKELANFIADILEGKGAKLKSKRPELVHQVTPEMTAENLKYYKWLLSCDEPAIAQQAIAHLKAVGIHDFPDGTRAINSAAKKLAIKNLGFTSESDFNKAHQVREREAAKKLRGK